MNESCIVIWKKEERRLQRFEVILYLLLLKLVIERLYQMEEVGFLFEVMRHSYETVWKERLLYYVGVLVHFSHVLVDLFVFFIIELSFLYFNGEMRVFYCIILSLLFCFCLSYRHVVVLFFVFIFRFFSISTGFTMI